MKFSILLVRMQTKQVPQLTSSWSLKSLRSELWLLMNFWMLTFAHSSLGQDCKPPFTLNPVATNNTIEWGKFPEFNLPFTIIYNGPRFNDHQSQPLKHGFSHLAGFSGSEPATLPASKRALLWNSVASLPGTSQPWSDLGVESPWGNDTTLFRANWASYLKHLANSFDDSRGQPMPKADILCLDIERMQELDRDILLLKTEKKVPAQYLALSDADFLAKYKKDIRWWYTEAANYLTQNHLDPTTKIGSYSDVPVRGTWLNIPTNTWQDWTTNKQRTHYLMQDDNGNIGGSFYNAMDLHMPSAYYYYPYENPFGKDYLSYLLFQIEVNTAWSDKPIVPFLWLRYHDSFVSGSPLIPDFIAEATAIFPFFSGAKGVWLWDNPLFENTAQQNYATYEHFIYGLYRLSQFAHMFEGDYQLVIPQSARDHMVAQNPIWRGVVKGNRIVIAAQNPYAADGQQVSVNVYHNNWFRTITLTGKEIFLCEFDLTDTLTSAEDPLLYVQIAPNPSDGNFTLLVNGSIGSATIDFSLFDISGRLVKQQPLKVYPGETRYAISVNPVSSGVYIARITSATKTITKKVVIIQ
jgi:hypothetical protein